jgi:hypothetical protein
MDATMEVSRTMVIGHGAAPESASPAAEVVAGYALQERLGVGGFGEVWSAVGPGGLRKAVKILHGNFDDPQAHVEMRALRSVRELRHPFLLNVERAEVVGARLIIVTELADRSLQDRFQEACRDGLRGIPRDELIGYLRDAADALDFIFEAHGLQHLDIKPENLLLQGSHVKVGDLGLIKDVKCSQASLINGFTALYAAPEIFEGHASGASDQYSLAIVYQQMLTGVPPFNGRTPAQLTAQHLKGTPQLAVLTPADRRVVARALSKNPKARYPTCKQFIEDLASSHSRSRAAAAPKMAAAPAAHEPATPQVVEPIVLPSTPLPATVEPQDRGLRPTVLLGIGGLAKRVLRDVVGRLTDRYGGLDQCRAFQALAIDTDTRGANDAGPVSGLMSEAPVDAMAIPLRQAKDYRAMSGDLLEWLSRRWLFNIPRSRQVEGIRPLGRLALVDHQEEIRSRLRVAFQSAVADAARLARAGDDRFPNEGGPLEVVIVASISGGTGSGGVLDLGYLARDVAKELRLTVGSIVGMLLYGSGLGDRQGDVQNANAIACLEELRHILALGMGYPGDRACRLPATELPPFDHTYLVPLGDGLNDEAFQRETRAIGRYLFSNVASEAGEYCRSWRRRERSRSEAGAPISTLRAISVAVDEPELAAERLEEAARICRATVSRWATEARLCVEGAFPDVPAVNEACEGLLSSLNLTKAALASQLNARLRGETNQRLESYLQSAWPRLRACMTGGPGQVGTVFALIDADLGRRDTRAARLWPGQASGPIEEIRRWVVALLDSSEGRCAHARAGLMRAVSRLKEMLEEWQHVVKEMNNERQLLVRDALERAAHLAAQPALAEALKVPCLQYCMLHFCQEAYDLLVAYLESICKSLLEIDADLAALAHKLCELEAVCNDGRGRVAQRGAKPPAVLSQKFDEMLRQKNVFRMSELWHDPGRLPVIAGRLHRAALDFIARPVGWTDDGEAGAADRREELPLIVELATARLANRGGGCRLMAIVPDQRDVTPLQRALNAAFGECSAVLADDGQPPCVCYELEGLPIERVIGQIAAANPHLPEMAARLKTRVDVNW